MTAEERPRSGLGAAYARLRRRSTPRRPDLVRPALPIVLVGLPVLVALLILGARLASGTWALAVEHAATSPYSWIIAWVYLNYALTWRPTERREHRRWPGLHLAENLFVGLLAIGLISGDHLPDRWYGTLAETVLAMFGAGGLANAAQQIFGRPSPPDQEPAIPIGPSRGPSSLAG